MRCQARRKKVSYVDDGLRDIKGRAALKLVFLFKKLYISVTKKKKKVAPWHSSFLFFSLPYFSLLLFQPIENQRWTLVWWTQHASVYSRRYSDEVLLKSGILNEYRDRSPVVCVAVEVIAQPPNIWAQVSAYSRPVITCYS